MPEKLRVVRSLPVLRRALLAWRAHGARIALVPTMGALHAGHLALVRTAKRRAERVVVSIFVNPAQFAPGEDLASYPKTFDSDLCLLAKFGVDLVWAPPAEMMYPAGFSTGVVPGGPALVGLEDRFRPQFFSGVATVVTKLLIQCAPDFATFGEKDYQQLKVVSRVVADLDVVTRILAVDTVREKDGLALSSRNAYLSPQQRAVASTLYRVLKLSSERIAKGEHIARVVDEAGRAIEKAGFSVDYFEARNAATLMPVMSPTERPIRLLVAARLAKTRLIDNVAV